MAGQAVKRKERKAGRARVVFDQAAALEALIFARGGQQLRLPGVAPAPADSEPGRVGRPPGAHSVAPELWRQWLLLQHGSVIEGLVKTGTAPVASIVAELVQAHAAVWRAVHGTAAPALGHQQILELVTTAAQMRLTAQRYAAPYQHSPAPTQIKLERPPQRAAIGLFVGTVGASGQVQAEALDSAAGLLSRLLSGTEQNQSVSDAVEVELNAGELNAPAGSEGK